MSTAMKPCPVCGSMLAARLADSIANPIEEESCPKKGSRFETPEIQRYSNSDFDSDAWSRLVDSMKGFADAFLGSFRSRDLDSEAIAKYTQDNLTGVNR